MSLEENAPITASGEKKASYKNGEGVLYNYQHSIWWATLGFYACGCSEWGVIHQMEFETDGMHTFVVIIWVNGFSGNALVTGIGAANAEQADAFSWIEKEYLAVKKKKILNLRKLKTLRKPTSGVCLYEINK